MTEPRMPSTPVRLRPALSGLPDYTPGRPATTLPDGTAYKISSNENPFPPLPSVHAVVTQAAGQLNRYPDMSVTALRERIAEALEVSAAQIATGPGSVGVLAQILSAVCEPGDEVIFAWRSFEAYPILTRLTGAEPVLVPLTADARHDLPAMAAAVTPATRALLVCSPNNPTGPVVGAAEFAELLATVPREVLVVLDEAYVEFGTDPDVPDGLALLREHPNLVVLRTFSKAYGLAALRVGYAVASSPIAEALRKTAIPFGVNSLAQVAAIASLDAEAELLTRVKELVAERERVVAALTAQGWRLPRTEANFVWFPVGDSAMEFAARCDAAGLSVRPFAGDGVRATVAEADANDRLLAVAGAFLAERAAGARD